MRKVLTLASVLFCCFAPNLAESLYGEYTSNTPRVIIVAKTLPTSPSRPRIPSHSVIELSYYPEQNLCIFNLGDTDIQYMTVEIENLESGETYCDMVDASYPCINISLTPSTYSITCTTDDDSIYTGEFEIQ